MELSGWIRWPGGKCPVDPDQEVDVIYFDGRVYRGKADEFIWLHFDGDRPGRTPSDVVMYRLR